MRAGRACWQPNKVFLNVGSHAAIPGVPGLEDARPLTHIDALELDHVPPHLIVLGGGYVGLEMAQVYRRFGSRITVIESGPQLMSREDLDVADAMQRILSDEGIRLLLSTQTNSVIGRSGEGVSLFVHTAAGGETIEGSESWSLRDASRTRQDSGLSLGAGGMRRQSAVHACLRRRLPDHRGQFGRGDAQHATGWCRTVCSPMLADLPYPRLRDAVIAL